MEIGWTWNGAPSVWQKWGNGIKEGTEGWDDGNTTNLDGCSSIWSIESGWTCNGSTPSICQKWANGIKEGAEGCDDGNTKH